MNKDARLIRDAVEERERHLKKNLTSVILLSTRLTNIDCANFFAEQKSELLSMLNFIESTTQNCDAQFKFVQYIERVADFRIREGQYFLDLFRELQTRKCQS